VTATATTATAATTTKLTTTRTLNRLPFLGPIFALGWPLDDPGGPRNQLKKIPKSRKQCLNGTKYVQTWPISSVRGTHEEDDILFT
jgi:hypothetical protein